MNLEENEKATLLLNRYYEIRANKDYKKGIPKRKYKEHIIVPTMLDYAFPGRNMFIDFTMSIACMILEDDFPANEFSEEDLILILNLFWKKLVSFIKKDGMVVKYKETYYLSVLSYKVWKDISSAMNCTGMVIDKILYKPESIYYTKRLEEFTKSFFSIS